MLDGLKDIWNKCTSIPKDKASRNTFIYRENYALERQIDKATNQLIENEIN